MAAVVHGGSLGRWFEQLCRIRHRKLREVVVPSAIRLRSGELPKQGGLYAFWWTSDGALLHSPECNRDITLVGPAGRKVRLRITDEWLGTGTCLPIPLYVGKSADSLSKRIGLHLRLSERRMLPVGPSSQRLPRPTTSCQLRAGVEHLFPSKEDTRSLMLDSVGVSFVVLDGNDHAADRFYLEDLAIGLMRPVFNVDVER